MSWPYCKRCPELSPAPDPAAVTTTAEKYVFLPIINWIHLNYCFCFIFKFTQALYQYAVRIGLTAAYRDNEAERGLIKMAIALALLPPRLVWDGFQVTENKKCYFSFGFYIIFYLQRLSNNVWKNYPIMLDLRRESN
jgi:hypothetical protein